jgi:hypothetical protein
MGNIVTGEALRIYATEDPVGSMENPPKLIDCYVAAKAAVPAQMYNSDFTDGDGIHQTSLGDMKTPNCYAYYFSGGYFYDRDDDKMLDIPEEPIWVTGPNGTAGEYNSLYDTVIFDRNAWIDTLLTPPNRLPRRMFVTTIPDGTPGIRHNAPYFDNFIDYVQVCRIVQQLPDSARLGSEKWVTNNKMFKPDSPKCEYSAQFVFP